MLDSLDDDDALMLATAQEAARRAGAVLESWAGRFTVSEKSRFNLVTEADVAAQETIVETIRRRYPDHALLGEEGLSRPGTNSDCRWIIDPLDGTSNYVHRFPYYAVSIGLERKGQLRVGVIFDPNRQELFWAVRGHGAFLNGKPLRPTEIDSLSRAFVVASLPVATRRDDPAVDRFLKVLTAAQALQRTGSAALNLAYVAAGRMDAYWSGSLKPWDMAAGVLLVEEAGGRITRMDGSQFRVDVPDVLASNGTAVHRELSTLLM